MMNFNPSNYFKDMVQTMFDFGKVFDLSKVVPEFNMGKVWDLNKKNIDTASNVQKMVNEQVTEIADKQSAMMRENAESAMSAVQDMSQAQMTPQRMLEMQSHLYQDGMARNMKHARELGEMYTKANMKFLEAMSDQVKKGMDDCYSARGSKSGMEQAGPMPEAPKGKKK